MITLLDLAARVDAATGPDRALDADIEVAFGATTQRFITSSASAVIALIERELPGSDWGVSWAASKGRAFAYVEPSYGFPLETNAGTPALALLSAALTAIHQVRKG